MTPIRRRKLLVLLGSLTLLGLGTGTVAGKPSASVAPISVDAANIRGYWAATRNDALPTEV